MNDEHIIIPFCPVEEWKNNHLNLIPHDIEERSFVHGQEPFTIRSNWIELLDMLSERLSSYRAEGVANIHSGTVIDVFKVDSPDGISLSNEWSSEEVKRLTTVYLMKDESDSLSHLKWGSYECFYRAPDFIASISPFEQKAVKIICLSPNHEMTSSDQDHCLNEDILMDFILALYARTNGYFSFHAAYLGDQDRGIMISGDSGSGKTTTAMSLLRDGFSFFTDDMALVRKTDDGHYETTGWFMPPRFIRQAPSSLDAVEESLTTRDLRTVPRKIKVKSKKYISGNDSFANEDPYAKKTMNLPESVQLHTSGKWIVPVAIFFIQQRTDGQEEHEFHEISIQEGLPLLMKQTLDPTNASRMEELVDYALGILQQCKVYRLFLGSNLRTISKVIRQASKEES
jgi:hypothetical protein